MDARIRLVPAESQDKEFLFNLKKAAVGDYVTETYGVWDEQKLWERFDQEFDPRRVQIIQYDSANIGMLAVRMTREEIQIQSIEILPEYQYRGIGSSILRDLIGEAELVDLPIRCQALRVNPVRQLLERLGFQLVGETTTHFHFRRPKISESLYESYISPDETRPIDISTLPES